MRLLDKNGKIFGKVNILDSVILLLVLLCVFAVSANKFFPNRVPKLIKRMPQQKEYVVEIILDKERNWLTKYIHKGDGQRDIENNFTAQIIDIEKSQGMHDSDAVIIKLRLKANIDDSGFVIYGSNLLRPGEDFVFETKDYLIKGLVYSVEGAAN